jgi:hypothetical protein
MAIAVSTGPARLGLFAGLAVMIGATGGVVAAAAVARWAASKAPSADEDVLAFPGVSRSDSTTIILV